MIIQKLLAPTYRIDINPKAGVWLPDQQQDLSLNNDNLRSEYSTAEGSLPWQFLAHLHRCTPAPENRVQIYAARDE
ncbi:MAG: hypothetical protein AAF827_13005 [Cyanobacteria bacterium P01_D01_bin.6]